MLWRLESGRGREALTRVLIDEAEQDPDRVVGLDFALSFPLWYLRERGLDSVRAPTTAPSSTSDMAMAPGPVTPCSPGTRSSLTLQALGPIVAQVPKSASEFPPSPYRRQTARSSPDPKADMHFATGLARDRLHHAPLVDGRREGPACAPTRVPEPWRVSMRVRQPIRASCCGLVVLFVAACGDTATDPPPLEEEEVPITPAERLEAIEAIAAFVKSLAEEVEDFDAQTEPIIDHLLARPHIIDAGANESGQTVWAVFSDSTLFFLLELAVFPDEGAVASGERGRVAPAGVTKAVAMTEPQAPSTLSAARNVPNVRYRVLNGLGNFFTDTDATPQIRRMLDAAGYQDGGGGASVESLRNVAGDGVFYFHTHGGFAYVRALHDGGRREALWTTTRVDPSRETGVLAEDISANRVGWAVMTNRRRHAVDKTGIEDPHYMITDLFIEKYWGEFGRHSLVYISACQGGSPGFARTRLLLGQKGVSVYFGWTDNVTSTVLRETAEFLIDRLLGANEVTPESPPQRPFDYISVFEEHVGPGRYGFDAETGAVLNPTHLGADFGVLAPSIRHAEVDEREEVLWIHGIFGEDRGERNRTVTVGGQALPVSSWQEELLEIESFPSNLAGPLVVNVADKDSNEAPITEWQGLFRYTFDLGELMGEEPNTLLHEVVCQVRIRQDVHRRRDRPGADPVADVIPFLATQDSECTWEMRGTIPLDDGSMSIAGGGTLAWADPDDTPPHYGGEWFVFFGEVDTETKVLQLRFGTSSPLGEFRLETPEGTEVLDHPLIIDPAFYESPARVDLDDSYGILGSSVTHTTHDGSAKLEWSSIPARHAPDADTAS